MILHYIAKFISLAVGLAGFWTLTYYFFLTAEKTVSFEKMAGQIGFPLSQSHGILLFFGAGLLFLLVFFKEGGTARTWLLSIATLVLALTGITWVAGFQILSLNNIPHFVPILVRPIGIWQPFVVSIIGFTSLFFSQKTAAVAVVCGLLGVILGAIGFFSGYAVGPLFAAVLGIGFILEGVYRIRTEQIL